MSLGELSRFIVTWALVFIAAGQIASDFWARRGIVVGILLGVSLAGLFFLVQREALAKMVAVSVALGGVLGIGRVAATTIANGGLSASATEVIQLVAYSALALGGLSALRRATPRDSVDTR